MSGNEWVMGAVPVIVALVALAKQVGFPPQYAGVLAAAIGIVGGVAVHVLGTDALANLAYLGLLAGLAASGLYSTSKNALGK